MKYTTTLLVLVASAAAVPAEMEPRMGKDDCKVNGNNGKKICCSGLLNCLVGGSCSNQAYCCNTNAPAGTLVNVALLNCVHI
ncbi:Farnesyl pyrophosphate synthase [Purpureocillium lavendulum]|uniref:Farnesyl pyrophosphate synthase n=1 Tax=Purpureocillium lavendulum TaxID=1247861 RepID=A0AB34FL74_9HYPO|nr:Farnesyl pyrophosphate synthase [Purpureocillium lavendulum]